MIELKQRYKALRGSMPRGPSASNIAWLHAQIASIEAQQGRVTEEAATTAPEEGGGEEEERCLVCDSTEQGESMILCDGCENAKHTFCCSPKLERVPEGDWYCGECPASKVAALDKQAVPSSESGANGKADGETVAALKQAYKELKGAMPRGNCASDPTWLRTKISEMQLVKA